MLNSKDRLRLSRLLSRLENLGQDEPIPQFNSDISGSAYKLGVTGPLGVGKSSLINEIVKWYRKKRISVGVIAVDPSSPFTGGALLGDRVRMNEFANDEGVFIRSFATRGATGGLASSTINAANLLDQAGFQRIIIETVGVGQVEVDIVGACDIVLLVLEPASGDIIQTMKAGLMEIADLFIVNKKDLPGADRFISELEMMLEMKFGKLALKESDIEHHKQYSTKENRRTLGIEPIVLATNARNSEGIDDLCEKIENWLKNAQQNGSLSKRRYHQRCEQIRKTAEELLLKRLWRELPQEEIERLAKDNLSIRDAAEKLIYNCQIKYK